MSKAADDWAKKMGTGWEKAPVQMLAQVIYPRILLYMCPHTAVWEKAPVRMLAQVIRLLVLLYMCPHTAMCVASSCYTCALILLYI